MKKLVFSLALLISSLSSINEMNAGFTDIFSLGSLQDRLVPLLQTVGSLGGLIFIISKVKTEIYARKTEDGSGVNSRFEAITQVIQKQDEEINQIKNAQVVGNRLQLPVEQQQLPQGDN